MVLDAALLNTQQYKVRIKGKVEQSREWSSVLLYTPCAVTIEKVAFGLPSTKVTNFTYFVTLFLNELELICFTLLKGSQVLLSQRN